VIEAFGSTELVQVGNNYFLDSISTGSGPELKYNGASVLAGQFGGWTPIGAEQTATGYEVAWKVAGVDQYSIWSTDSNGNYISNLIGGVSGTSTSFESFEPSFHQDLNGDGVIGVPAATSGIPSSPVTQAAPVTVANNDTFAFRSDLGAGVVPNAGSAETIELDGHSPLTSNQLTALLHDPHSGPPLAPFEAVIGGHDTITDPVNHDGAAMMRVQTADLYAGLFIIH
jgi:serralysin